ncbi:MAG: hypothetical protein IPK83_13770 [Planctomycetes bacterium]|nr:hypothetical protein [Planctomycetota bacterium]
MNLFAGTLLEDFKNDPFPILLVGGFVAIGLLIGVFSHYAAKKRREALRKLALEAGFSFDEGREPGLYVRRCSSIDLFNQGNNRYTFNHLVGERNGQSVVACDYHYETYSRDKNGKKTTHHHYYGMVLLRVGLNMPQVKIRREGLFDKIAGALGFDDIDFESAEFSRKFHVSAADRKFAYDLIHPRAMEYLLETDNLSWEFDGDVIAVYKHGVFDPGRIMPAIQTAVGFVKHVPEFVKADRSRTGSAG